jgi:NADH-quinone oxidoreductase subunit E
MDIEKVDRIIHKHGGDPRSLIQVLVDIQAENHWLPQEALERVSEKLQVPMGRIRHVASFYKSFSLVPKGRHEVHVCVGTSCHVRGASRVLDAVCEATGAAPGEADADMEFSVEAVHCLGCCALGPLVVVDGKTHGKLTPAEASDVMKRIE